MNLTSYLHHLYEYNYWANERYLAVAETLTPEQLHRSQGHSWGNVHDVLVHMLSSEWVWLQRWNGISPKGHLNPADFPTLAHLRSRWNEHKQAMLAFVRAQTDESLQKEITYQNFSGETFHVPLWQMLMHVINHNTHHRGELAAMFALMNIPHPEEEVIQYFLNQNGQKKF